MKLSDVSAKLPWILAAFLLLWLSLAWVEREDSTVVAKDFLRESPVCGAPGHVKYAHLRVGKTVEVYCADGVVRWMPCMLSEYRFMVNQSIFVDMTNE